MKRLKITGLIVVILVVICWTYVVKTNNTAYLFVDKYETGGQAGVKRLNEMINDAWLDREFFEVIVYSKNNPPFCLH